MLRTSAMFKFMYLTKLKYIRNVNSNVECSPTMLFVPLKHLTSYRVNPFDKLKKIVFCYSFTIARRIAGCFFFFTDGNFAVFLFYFVVASDLTRTVLHFTTRGLVKVPMF